MKTSIFTLILCPTLCFAASSKDKASAKYQDATFQETHSESVRMNCGGTGYENTMTSCHDAETLVYTVKAGETVYTLIPYGTWPHHESLWKQAGGTAVAVWNDGKHVHVRTGGKESQYDIMAESAQDAAK